MNYALSDTDFIDFLERYCSERIVKSECLGIAQSENNHQYEMLSALIQSHKEKRNVG